jgi:acetylornithine deacetylase/succinyl-diaminopimelate desuccinylase-like protein
MNRKHIKNKHLDELKELLSIPSISAHSVHKKDMISAAKWLQKKLNSLKFETKILPTGGHPVVFAQYTTHNSRPTILIYGHYDVQDPGDLSLWKSDPFKPEIRGGNIYARGAADDKGQLYTWIAALEILQGTVPCNIKFMIEGEEEVGSKNLDVFIQKNKKLLKSDICVISDSHCLSETKPVIDYGLRGIVYTEITVKTLERDVHSGIYGGNVLNPAVVLSQIISKLKNENHSVLIPGFYENVRKLKKSERDELKKLPFKDKQVMNETGALVVTGESGYIVHERAGARPTLDVNGIWSGYNGEGEKTIIPAVAKAKVSMRIVPNQTSDEISNKFINYVNTLEPDGVDLKVEVLSTGNPILMDTSSLYFKTAENAYKKVFGKKPLYKLSGGSIPVTSILKKHLGLDSVLMGYGLPDDNLHSPNEKLSLTMFEKGIKTNIEFLKSF